MAAPRGGHFLDRGAHFGRIELVLCGFELGLEREKPLVGALSGQGEGRLYGVHDMVTSQ